MYFSAKNEVSAKKRLRGKRGSMIDKIAFRSLSYGLYLVTAQDGEKQAGCVVNTFSQVTSSPAQGEHRHQQGQFHDGRYYGVGHVRSVGACPKTLLWSSSVSDFHSSADTDKFQETETRVDEAGVPYVWLEHTVAHFCVKVKQTMDWERICTSRARSWNRRYSLPKSL